MGLVLVTSDRFADHLTPPGHPERLARAHVMEAVARQWASRGVPVMAPVPATRDDLTRVHTPAYVEQIESTSGRAVRLDPDTFTSPATAQAAALGAGAAICAVDAVLDGWAEASSAPAARGDVVRGALVLVRPPGHHATARRAMGFCIYNNVAIAAAHALARGLTRVAIVDYDVHHGNGTQSTFFADPRVLFVSTHQFPFYPGSGAAREVGEGAGAGFTVNVPLAAGSTDADYALVFDRAIVPVLHAFSPQLLLVSAGFDPHMRDPLAGMRMSVAGLNRLAQRLHDCACEVGAPVVFAAEGGYHLKVLGACLDGIAAILDAGAHSSAPPDSLPVAVSGGGPQAEPLRADDAPLLEQATPEPTGRGERAFDLVRDAQRMYWPGL